MLHRSTSCLLPAAVRYTHQMIQGHQRWLLRGMCRKHFLLLGVLARTIIYLCFNSPRGIGRWKKNNSHLAGRPPWESLDWHKFSIKPGSNLLWGFAYENQLDTVSFAWSWRSGTKLVYLAAAGLDIDDSKQEFACNYWFVSYPEQQIWQWWFEMYQSIIHHHSCHSCMSVQTQPHFSSFHWKTNVRKVAVRPGVTLAPLTYCSPLNTDLVWRKPQPDVSCKGKAHLHTLFYETVLF